MKSKKSLIQMMFAFLLLLSFIQCISAMEPGQQKNDDQIGDDRQHKVALFKKLMDGIESSDISMIKQAIEEGADVTGTIDRIDRGSMQVLGQKNKIDDETMMSMFPNIAQGLGIRRAPLFAAITASNTQTIRLLCAQCPSLVDELNTKGETPLTFAAAHASDYTPPIRVLLEMGADKTKTNQRNDTAYQVACMHNNFKIAALLK